MDKTNKTSISLVIAFVVVVVLFLLFGSGAMMGSTIGSGVMGSGSVIGSSGMMGGDGVTGSGSAGGISWM